MRLHARHNEKQGDKSANECDDLRCNATHACVISLHSSMRPQEKNFISFVPADEKYINFACSLCLTPRKTYLAEHIHELALALVAPLRSEDDVDAVVGAGHGLSSGQLGLSNILLAGSSGSRS